MQTARSVRVVSFLIFTLFAFGAALTASAALTGPGDIQGQGASAPGSGSIEGVGQSSGSSYSSGSSGSGGYSTSPSVGSCCSSSGSSSGGSGGSNYSPGDNASNSGNSSNYYSSDTYSGSFSNTSSGSSGSSRSNSNNRDDDEDDDDDNYYSSDTYRGGFDTGYDNDSSNYNENFQTVSPNRYYFEYESGQYIGGGSSRNSRSNRFNSESTQKTYVGDDNEYYYQDTPTPTDYGFNYDRGQYRGGTPSARGLNTDGTYQTSEDTTRTGWFSGIFRGGKTQSNSGTSKETKKTYEQLNYVYDGSPLAPYADLRLPFVTYNLENAGRKQQPDHVDENGLNVVDKFRISMARAIAADPKLAGYDIIIFSAMEPRKANGAPGDPIKGGAKDRHPNGYAIDVSLVDSKGNVLPATNAAYKTVALQTAADWGANIGLGPTITKYDANGRAYRESYMPNGMHVDVMPLGQYSGGPYWGNGAQSIGKELTQARQTGVGPAGKYAAASDIISPAPIPQPRPGTPVNTSQFKAPQTGDDSDEAGGDTGYHSFQQEGNRFKIFNQFLDRTRRNFGGLLYFATGLPFFVYEEEVEESQVSRVYPVFAPTDTGSEPVFVEGGRFVKILAESRDTEQFDVYVRSVNDTDWHLLTPEVTPSLAEGELWFAEPGWISFQSTDGMVNIVSFYTEVPA